MFLHGAQKECYLLPVYMTAKHAFAFGTVYIAALFIFLSLPLPIYEFFPAGFSSNYLIDTSVVFNVTVCVCVKKSFCNDKQNF